MLIVQRKVGQKIELSGGITIHVTKITPTTVKLAIQAPGEVIVVWDNKPDEAG